MMKKWISLVLLALLSSGCVMRVTTFPEISGTVVDGGEPVEGVLVTRARYDRSAEKTVVTDAAGRFKIKAKKSIMLMMWGGMFHDYNVSFKKKGYHDTSLIAGSMYHWAGGDVPEMRVPLVKDFSAAVLFPDALQGGGQFTALTRVVAGATVEYGGVEYRVVKVQPGFAQGEPSHRHAYESTADSRTLITLEDNNGNRIDLMGGSNECCGRINGYYDQYKNGILIRDDDTDSRRLNMVPQNSDEKVKR